MKNMLLDIARASGGMGLARMATRRSLRILCYHGIWTSDGPPHGECLFMRPEQFAERMRWLAASHYHVVDLDEAVARLADDTLPANAVALTIDDGWRSTYTHMLPVLERLRLPATLYASTYYVERQEVVVNVAINHILERAPVDALALADLLPQFPTPVPLGDRVRRAQVAVTVNAAVDALPTLAERVATMQSIAARAGVPIDCAGDQFRFMSTGELLDAHARGLRIELHTHRHQSVDRPGTDLHREIADNRAALAALGIEAGQRHFCYPCGDYIAAAEVPLAEAGIVSATNTSRYLNPPGTHPYRLGRFVDGPRVTQRVFEAYLSGALELIDYRARRRFGGGRRPYGSGTSER